MSNLGLDGLTSMKNPGSAFKSDPWPGHTSDSSWCVADKDRGGAAGHGRLKWKEKAVPPLWSRTRKTSPCRETGKETKAGEEEKKKQRKINRRWS